ncbi:MAG: ECF transporter S component [Clostridiales bacterium]|nr:ECF transporter S component [Clostridiales bacterium]
MNKGSSDKKTAGLVYTALTICLILLGTVLFRIPIPMTQGYVHLGDTMIYLGVLMLGRRHGAAAAGLGSALADVLGGFAFWAPWSLVIKALMAFVTGLIIEKSTGGSKDKLITVSAMTAGGIIMCAGYLAAETVMYGSFAAAVVGLPWNIGQFAVGILLSTAIYSVLRKLRVS